MINQWSLGIQSLQKVENNLTQFQLLDKIFGLLNSGTKESDLVLWQPEWQAWKGYTEVEEIKKEIELLKKQDVSKNPPALPKLTIPPPLTLTVDLKTKNDKFKILNKETKSHFHNKNEIKPLVKNDHPLVTNKNANSNSVRRKHPRIFARLRCIIKTETLTFRTFTQDISLGGVSLEDEIPQDLIGQKCHLYISSPKIKTNLKFKIALTERCVARFFSFQDAPDSVIEELSYWLNDLEKKSKAS